jgi:hypothetical protein
VVGVTLQVAAEVVAAMSGVAVVVEGMVGWD